MPRRLVFPLNSFASRDRTPVARGDEIKRFVGGRSPSSVASTDRPALNGLRRIIKPAPAMRAFTGNLQQRQLSTWAFTRFDRLSERSGETARVGGCYFSMSVKESLIALEQCRKHLATFERERNWSCAADEASVMLKLYRDLLIGEKLEQQFHAPEHNSRS